MLFQQIAPCEINLYAEFSNCRKELVILWGLSDGVIYPLVFDYQTRVPVTPQEYAKNP